MQVEEHTDQLVRRLRERLCPERELDDLQLRHIIQDNISEEFMGQYIRLEEKKELEKKVFDSIRRMDVIQDLLEDPEITEIMINGWQHIFVEKRGALYETGRSFSRMDKLDDIVQQIAGRGNRIVNESSPILDVRLQDGSRVNIVLRPVALDGPVVTIRKFPEKALTMEDLIQYGSITEEVAEYLHQLVKARYNLFISGGTGSGKTTFLNILSNYIPRDERIITVEDSAELQIKNVDNLVRLEARNANVEGKNEITVRDLVKSALRMRPDRIIVGEIRDATAIDMLTAFNTGHDGSLSTGHANSAADMLQRLETLVLTGMDIPLAAIRQQIASAIDVVIHLGRLRDKSRRVLEVDEVCGLQDGLVSLTPLFRFEDYGDFEGKVRGELVATGKKLANQEKLLRNR